MSIVYKGNGFAIERDGNDFRISWEEGPYGKIVSYSISEENVQKAMKSDEDAYEVKIYSETGKWPKRVPTRLKKIGEMSFEYMNLMDKMDLGEPSTPAEIEAAENKMGISFPTGYKDFMLSHNGAEGESGNDNYLAIWTIEEVPELNEAYGVKEFTPGLVYFASDGGDIIYAFDMRDDRKAIVRFPADCIHIEKAVVISDTFPGFVDYLYHYQE